MNSWEVIAKAINNPGTKIVNQDGLIIYYDGGEWLNITGDDWDSGFHEGDKWQEFKKKAKLVEWHRPKVVWYEDTPEPTLYTGCEFRRSKENYSSREILEWETIMAPEAYEDCDD